MSQANSTWSWSWNAPAANKSGANNSSWSWNNHPSSSWQSHPNPSQVPWSCSFCGGQNHSPKTKCFSCGLKKNFVAPVRSYAQVAAQNPHNATNTSPPTATQHQHAVHAQLAMVSERLLAATAPDSPPEQNCSVPPPPLPFLGAPATAGAPQATPLLTRQITQTSIKELEAAAALMSADVPSMSVIREDLLRQASDLKKALMV